MVPYDYFDNDGYLTSGLAWLLFAQNGQPGYYLMYNDLLRLEEDEGEDERLR